MIWKLSWAGTKYDECSAVVEADDTARVSTMPRMIRDSEIEELLSLKRENNKVLFLHIRYGNADRRGVK